MWVVIKIARAGRLIYDKRFETLEAVAQHLKTTPEVVGQIVEGHRFPRGKLCVFNKYVVRRETPSDVPADPLGVVSFT